MRAWTRFLTAWSLAACLAGVPATLSLHGAAALTALAKGGNNGHGNGNSQGGNNDNSQGGNNGGGNSQSNQGGNSQGNPSDKSKNSASANTTTETNPVSGDTVTVSPGAIELVHSNGFSERIAGGRYQMRDGQGRLVIDRRATEKDRLRLLASVR